MTPWGCRTASSRSSGWKVTFPPPSGFPPNVTLPCTGRTGPNSFGIGLTALPQPKLIASAVPPRKNAATVPHLMSLPLPDGDRLSRGQRDKGEPLFTALILTRSSEVGKRFSDFFRHPS